MARQTPKALKTPALNVVCMHILEVIAQIVQKKDGREHEVYLASWELIQTQGVLLAAMFDRFTRNTA
jgi:hypothetical protein